MILIGPFNRYINCMLLQFGVLERILGPRKFCSVEFLCRLFFEFGLGEVVSQVVSARCSVS